MISDYSQKTTFASLVNLIMTEWIVPPEDSGKKLITFLSDRLGQKFSSRQLKKALESNQCQLNGRIERFASVQICKGDRIVLNLVEDTSVKKNFNFEQKRVLFEDSYFLAYNKPAGINCDEHGILRVLRSKIPSLQLIHRLDRDTTGVLLFAKDKTIFNKMVIAFREHRVDKEYMAIVDGVLNKKSGSIDNLLAKKHVYAGQALWGEVKTGGLHAHTDWIKMKEGNQATFVHCFPKTGRTHQLRVHFAEMGHPILGDYQYCKKFSCSYQAARHLLHAYRLSFIHPITGKKISIEAPNPVDLLEAEKILF